MGKNIDKKESEEKKVFYDYCDNAVLKLLDVLLKSQLTEEPDRTNIVIGVLASNLANIILYNASDYKSYEEKYEKLINSFNGLKADEEDLLTSNIAKQLLFSKSG